MSNFPAHARRGAGTGRRPVLVRLVLVTTLTYLGTVVVLVSSTTTHVDPPPSVSNGPRASLARTAERLSQRLSQRPGSSARGRTRPVAGGTGPRLFDVEDHRGDIGGPPYADLTALRLSDRGSGLRITVTLAGRPPSILAADVVESVGIDFYRLPADESDYRVLLDGDGHGWRAFLRTPNGYVRFPGTFAVGDRGFAVDLPWTAVGGRRTADVSAFADWSGGTGGSTTDTMPRSLLRLG